MTAEHSIELRYNLDHDDLWGDVDTSSTSPDNKSISQVKDQLVRYFPGVIDDVNELKEVKPQFASFFRAAQGLSVSTEDSSALANAHSEYRLTRVVVTNSSSKSKGDAEEKVTADSSEGDEEDSEKPSIDTEKSGGDASSKNKRLIALLHRPYDARPIPHQGSLTDWRQETPPFPLTYANVAAQATLLLLFQENPRESPILQEVGATTITRTTVSLIQLDDSDFHFQVAASEGSEPVHFLVRCEVALEWDQDAPAEVDRDHKYHLTLWRIEGEENPDPDKDKQPRYLGRLVGMPNQTFIFYPQEQPSSAKSDPVRPPEEISLNSGAAKDKLIQWGDWKSLWASRVTPIPEPPGGLEPIVESTQQSWIEKITNYMYPLEIVQACSTRLRWQAPSFYPDYLLIEVPVWLPAGDQAEAFRKAPSFWDIDNEPRRVARAYLLFPKKALEESCDAKEDSKDAEVVWLNGTSPPIHKLNDTALSLSGGEANDGLDAKDVAISYLRFFCWAVHGEEGAFNVVEKEADINWTEPPRGEDCTKVLDTLFKTRVAEQLDADAMNIVIPSQKTEDHYLIACMVYSHGFFKTILQVEPDGMVNMLTDDPVVDELSVHCPLFKGGGPLVGKPAKHQSSEPPTEESPSDNQETPATASSTAGGHQSFGEWLVEAANSRLAESHETPASAPKKELTLGAEDPPWVLSEESLAKALERTEKSEADHED